jgi:hypothetical protein
VLEAVESTLGCAQDAATPVPPTCPTTTPEIVVTGDEIIDLAVDEHAVYFLDGSTASSLRFTAPPADASSELRRAQRRRNACGVRT